MIEPLESLGQPAYTFPVTVKPVARRDNRMTQAHQRHLAIPAHFLRPILYGGRWWAAARLAGPCARFVTPPLSAALVVKSESADFTQHRSLS